MSANITNTPDPETKTLTQAMPAESSRRKVLREYLAKKFQQSPTKKMKELKRINITAPIYLMEKIKLELHGYQAVILPFVTPFVSLLPRTNNSSNSGDESVIQH